MAELADALDLGSSSERSTGSIPARCTSRLKFPPKIGPFRYNNLEGFYYEYSCVFNVSVNVLQV